MSDRFKKRVLPLMVLAAGGLSAFLLASAREVPDRRPSRSEAPLVEAVEVSSVPTVVTVVGHGTVQPKTEIQLVPQVSGRVVEIHPQLAGGGRFEKGELLLAIDPVDFELAVQRAAAEVARAEVRLETERAEAAVARDEWDRLHPGEDPDPLVVRGPQVRQAEAEVAAAEAALAEARLDLGRSRLEAPFAGRVLSETVDAGQYVMAGQPVATVYATDVLEVPVPLEDRELAWFEIGAPAELKVQYAGRAHHWRGTVVRSQGVDSQSRMVTVVVRVEDRWQAEGDRPQLIPGMFADVAIEGRSLTAVPVPRHAVHGGVAWVVADGVLRIRPVKVARTDRDTAFVTEGLQPGERVVTTPLEAVTDGMVVRMAGDGAGRGEGASSPEPGEAESTA